jgi:multidrug efflux pump subunit AcrA (membrane-fusion protein)
MKKSRITASILVASIAVGLIVFVKLNSERGEIARDFAEAKRGDIEIVVTGIGELVTENYVDIRGPAIVRNRYFRLNDIKIVDLVPEGTMVKKGDYVATLDKTYFDNRLKDELNELINMEADLEKKILDTAVVLYGLRDEIINQRFAVEEAQIKVEQSRFEPPAVIRMAEIDLDKSKRLSEQKKRNYHLRRAQIIKEIQNHKYYINRQKRKVEDYENVIAGFTIYSPGDGMVVYKKDRHGAKVKTGSMLWPYNLVVATLPDLSVMLSKIYISEIEIGKIRVDQSVEVTVDAFKEKSYKGQVASIGKIGEYLPNSDSKVFEVIIKLEDWDPALRPSMTTNNKVVINTFKNVIYVPIESLHAGTDNIPFVYTRDGTRQVVIPGESNGKNIIIEKGLEEGTSVYLNVPENSGKFTIAGNELIAVIKQREELKNLETERHKKERNLIAETNDVMEVFNADSLKTNEEDFLGGY